MPVCDRIRKHGTAPLARATWLALLILLVGLLAAPQQASAAGLTQVTGFGSNPGNLTMYSYLPANLPSKAPLVVALHGCTQSASDYYSHSGWPKYADIYGFALVFPQTDSSNNAQSCFNWYDPTKNGRGKGEALSIKQMVDYAVAHYGSDTHHIYITGLSAGGAMTANMLADYPDVFAAGSIDSGIPAFCATDLTSAYSCMLTNQNKTPQQWGDLARTGDPGYTGPWPRVAIWQGTNDTTVFPVNATESVAQWTNVWGISQTPSSTRSLTGGTTESIYSGANGRPAVESYLISGMSHGLAVQPGSGTDQCGTTGTFYQNYICSSYYTAKFWALDGSSGNRAGSFPFPSGQ
jgi:poly(hydroxyalkanoate) depolymerase family esterase